LKTILLTTGLLSLFVLSGCGVIAPVVPPTGLLYTDMQAPITTGPAEVGTKRGEASVTAILGLISTGDGSVAAAARNGRISKVSRVDYTYDNILGLYQKYTTIVYGE